jgi:hypothetical protein
VTQQVQLYGTLTGEIDAVQARAEEPLPGGAGADVLHLPDRAERARRAGF